MQNSSARASVDVGSVIAGTYTIEALIGRGGMGAVFLASHNRLPGKKVAIKVLHAEMEGEEVLARFNREAKIASLLSHPNIVHVEDYNVTADGMPYVVLEYLEGDSLAQRIRSGPLSLDQTFSIIRQVCSALAAAHGKNIVHRDLKPANIFLVPAEIDGAHREIAKVLDFGISKMRDGSTVKTQDSALLGTPQYMAPEQATGQHDKVDGRTDIFALGAIVYEMLSGTPAFSGQTIPEVVFKVVYEPPVDLATRVPNLPENVRTAVQTAMAKDAEARYPTVSAFVEALTGSPISVMRVAKPAAPEVGFAAGSNPKEIGKDALAQTMPSQNGAAAFATAAGIAATMPSQNRPAAAKAADEIGTAGTVPSMPAARGRGLTFAIAGALVVAGVVIGVVVMSGDKKHGRKKVAESAVAAAPPSQPAAAPAPAPAPAPTGSATPVTEPAATPPPDAAPPPTPALPVTKAETAPKKKPDHLGKGSAAAGAPPETTSTDDAPESVGENATRLKAAETAIKSGHWQDAEAQANAVIASEDATPRQRMRARMFHGIVKCHTNDEEAAKIDLRQLVRVPQMRETLINACHKAGYFDTIH